jgi:hypothetical protein
MSCTETERDAESHADDHKPHWADGPCPAWCEGDHPAEIGPRVVIGRRPGGEPPINLLPDEARHLGEGLIRLATMANDDSRLVKCEPCEGHEA